jgi:hypothetical protein
MKPSTFIPFASLEVGHSITVKVADGHKLVTVMARCRAAGAALGREFDCSRELDGLIRIWRNPDPVDRNPIVPDAVLMCGQFGK